MAEPAAHKSYMVKEYHTCTILQVHTTWHEARF